MVTCACLAGQGSIPERSFWHGHESLKLAVVGSNPTSGAHVGRVKRLPRKAHNLETAGSTPVDRLQWKESWRGARPAC